MGQIESEPQCHKCGHPVGGHLKMKDVGSRRTTCGRYPMACVANWCGCPITHEEFDIPDAPYHFDRHPVAQLDTELSLLVCQFGGDCVVRVERCAPMPTIVLRVPAFSDWHLVPNEMRILRNMTPDEIKKHIEDALDSKPPVPRVERVDERRYQVTTCKDLNPFFLLPYELDGLNSLARAAGATKDLEIFEPKSAGTWVQLPKIVENRDDWMRAEWAQGVLPVKIWRFKK